MLHLRQITIYFLHLINDSIHIRTRIQHYNQENTIHPFLLILYQLIKIPPTKAQRRSFFMLLNFSRKILTFSILAPLWLHNLNTLRRTAKYLNIFLYYGNITSKRIERQANGNEQPSDRTVPQCRKAPKFHQGL